MKKCPICKDPFPVIPFQGDTVLCPCPNCDVGVTSKDPFPKITHELEKFNASVKNTADIINDFGQAAENIDVENLIKDTMKHLNKQAMENALDQASEQLKLHELLLSGKPIKFESGLGEEFTFDSQEIFKQECQSSYIPPEPIVCCEKCGTHKGVKYRYILAQNLCSECHTPQPKKKEQQSFAAFCGLEFTAVPNTHGVYGPKQEKKKKESKGYRCKGCYDTVQHVTHTKNGKLCHECYNDLKEFEEFKKAKKAKPKAPRGPRKVVIEDDE